MAQITDLKDEGEFLLDEWVEEGFDVVILDAQHQIQGYVISQKREIVVRQDDPLHAMLLDDAQRLHKRAVTRGIDARVVKRYTVRELVP